MMAMPTAPALALRAKPLRVSSLRASIGIALALSITACAPIARDPEVDADMDDDIRQIATRDNFDGRMARVVLADGRATVAEVETWLAESQATKAKGENQ